MTSININAEPVSTVKVTGPTWNPNKGRDQLLKEQEERKQAFDKAQLESGKNLEMRLLCMEAAIKYMQDEIKALKGS